MVTVKELDPKMIANNMESFCLSHPGGLVKDELEALNVSIEVAAERMGLDLQTVKDVVEEKVEVSSEFALLFEALTGVPAHILVDMQKEYDMLSAKRNQNFMKKLEGIRRIAAVF